MDAFITRLTPEQHAHAIQIIAEVCGCEPGNPFLLRQIRKLLRSIPVPPAKSTTLRDFYAEIGLLETADGKTFTLTDLLCDLAAMDPASCAVQISALLDVPAPDIDVEPAREFAADHTMQSHDASDIDHVPQTYNDTQDSRWAVEEPYPADENIDPVPQHTGTNDDRSWEETQLHTPDVDDIDRVPQTHDDDRSWEETQPYIADNADIDHAPQTHADDTQDSNWANENPYPADENIDPVPQTYADDDRHWEETQPRTPDVDDIDRVPQTHVNDTQDSRRADEEPYTADDAIDESAFDQTPASAPRPVKQPKKRKRRTLPRGYAGAAKSVEEMLNELPAAADDTASDVEPDDPHTDAPASFQQQGHPSGMRGGRRTLPRRAAGSQDRTSNQPEPDEEAEAAPRTTRTTRAIQPKRPRRTARGRTARPTSTNEEAAPRRQPRSTRETESKPERSRRPSFLERRASARHLGQQEQAPPPPQQTSVHIREGNTAIQVQLNIDVPADADEETLRMLGRKINIVLQEAELNKSQVQVRIQTILQEAGIDNADIQIDEAE
ncbi:MAG: hypothetical protein K8S97_04010 [Anaerolineae bacterium]|nr:hypothetical protein [Anaerolineae bacterium]